jgi:hypothetical protein
MGESDGSCPSDSTFGIATAGSPVVGVGAEVDGASDFRSVAGSGIAIGFVADPWPFVGGAAGGTRCCVEITIACV